jgi:hypothetical protein
MINLERASTRIWQNKASHNESNSIRKDSIMKATDNTAARYEAILSARAAHQPWMGALLAMTPPRDGLTDDFHQPSSGPSLDRSRPRERVWDVILALVIVATCAALGWTGAFLL